MLIDARLRSRGVRDRVQIAVRCAEPAPIPVTGANVSAAVREILASRDIDYPAGAQVTAVEPGRL